MHTYKMKYVSKVRLRYSKITDIDFNGFLHDLKI